MVGKVIESPIGSNSDNGGYIDKVNKLFGLYKQPWCAMTGSDVLKEGNVIYPNIWSAMALSFKKAIVKYTLKDIVDGVYIPKPGDAIVYDYGAGRGHIDFVVSYHDGNWVLVGGNRGNMVAYWKGTTNKLMLNKAVYIIDVSGDYTYDYIIPQDVSFDTLRATVYHGKFHGRKMANGQVYDSSKFSAASNLYPLGSYVKIINPETNKKLVVQITDRMHPRMKGRIDLSNRAYKYLGIKSKNVLVKKEVM